MKPAPLKARARGLILTSAGQEGDPMGQEGGVGSADRGGASHHPMDASEGSARREGWLRAGVITGIFAALAILIHLAVT